MKQCCTRCIVNDNANDRHALLQPSVEERRSSPVPWPLSRQETCSSPQAVALNHVGSKPRLSPHFWPCVFATQAPNCMGSTDLPTQEGWKAELA